MTDLYSPVTLGTLTLRNRIVMGPMTRARVGQDGVPNAMTVEYYSQRASAGLIISEATNISPQARGFAFTPGIFNEAQVAGWRNVTDAVHKKGGLVFCQLWHVGRISVPSLQPEGALPVAPSAVKAEAGAFTDHGFEPCPEPRALELEEIAGVVDQFWHAANCAQQAGFDGVEVIAGGGYLIDQFLKDKTNQRTDKYGGSISNRLRFMTEVLEAVVGVWGAGRVGIRLSVGNPVNDISDSDRSTLFPEIIKQLNHFHLAYAHFVEGENIGSREMSDGFDFQKLRHAFNGSYLANNSFDLDAAIEARNANTADLIVFSRPYISNPDLVERFKNDESLAEGDPSTFYGGDAHGYIDYPALPVKQ